MLLFKWLDLLQIWSSFPFKVGLSQSKQVFPLSLPLQLSSTMRGKMLWMIRNSKEKPLKWQYNPSGDVFSIISFPGSVATSCSRKDSRHSPWWTASVSEECVLTFPWPWLKCKWLLPSTPRTHQFCSSVWLYTAHSHKGRKWNSFSLRSQNGFICWFPFQLL